MQVSSELIQQVLDILSRLASTGATHVMPVHQYPWVQYVARVAPRMYEI